MARYHGKSGAVYIAPSGTGVAVPIVATLSEWSIDFTRDTQEVTAFGDVNKVKVVGLPDISGRLSGFWDDTTADALFNAADSANGTAMYLYPSTNAISKYFYGPAFLQMSIASSIGGAVTLSGQFDGSGPWGRR
jgi:hypothetical protein